MDTFVVFAAGFGTALLLLFILAAFRVSGHASRIEESLGVGGGADRTSHSTSNTTEA